MAVSVMYLYCDLRGQSRAYFYFSSFIVGIPFRSMSFRFFSFFTSHADFILPVALD
jgi:hypothetical protein